MSDLKIGRIVLGVCQTNCYFIYHEGEKKVIFIDPADDGKYINQTLKSKGFEVVGVSFDQDHESWTKGLKDLNMTWPQMSDLKYWDSSVVDLYAILGIPHTVLLDKDGIIIEKNLRGDALEAKLAELMQ